MYLTRDQYIAALKRFYDYIISGGKLTTINCNDTGNKDTQCTWGLCGRRKEMWPDKETHMWPNDKRNNGKPDIYGIKYLPNAVLCPMDKREEHDGRGCYYSCRVFQGPIPSREEAVVLYELSLERVQS